MSQEKIFFSGHKYGSHLRKVFSFAGWKTTKILNRNGKGKLLDRNRGSHYWEIILLSAKTLDTCTMLFTNMLSKAWYLSRSKPKQAICIPLKARSKLFSFCLSSSTYSSLFSFAWCKNNKNDECSTVLTAAMISRRNQHRGRIHVAQSPYAWSVLHSVESCRWFDFHYCIILNSTRRFFYSAG